MKLQSILAHRVFQEFHGFPEIDIDNIKYVAGVDAAYSKGLMYGAAVLLGYRTGYKICESIVVKKPAIPYVPGFLAFREAPAYISALHRLCREPDVIVVDGHGLSHPRGLGIATHIGLVLDKPSIGVAKKRLYGEEIMISGDTYIKAHDKIVGKIIIHRGKKLYISIGYKIKLESAIKIIEKMLKPQYKLPLPTALADQLSKKKARENKK